VHVAARQIIFWSVPAIALLVVLRAHIVRVVLGSGAFDWTDTRLTAAALALFSISIVAQGITLLLVRASYASGKTAAPLMIASMSAFLALALGSVFLKMFQHVDAAVFLEELLRVQHVPGSDMLALILAYSAASMIGTLLLIGYFEMHLGSFFSDVARAWWESLTAALLGGAAAYLTLNILGDITLASTLASVALKGCAAGLVGLAATASAYYFLGSREFGAAVEAFKRRLWREVEPVSSAE
jgi:putative peptidoglycan lipid II flippase